MLRFDCRCLVVHPFNYSALLAVHISVQVSKKRVCVCVLSFVTPRSRGDATVRHFEEVLVAEAHRELAETHEQLGEGE